MQIFDDKTVDLDLNGPILSFTTNPTGVGSTGVGIIPLVEEVLN